MHDLGEQIKFYLISGAIGAFGAIANAFYSSLKGRPMSIFFVIGSIVLGFFVGNLVGSFLPQDFQYRDGTLMVAGFASFPILDILEVRISKFFAKFMSLTTLL
jgi:RsiW-degrading membrane proteinase PrsW (M82 family)